MIELNCNPNTVFSSSRKGPGITTRKPAIYYHSSFTDSQRTHFTIENIKENIYQMPFCYVTYDD